MNRSVLNASLGTLKALYLNGKGYTLNNNPNHKSFRIKHINSGAFVLVSYKHRNRLVILEGFTPKNQRGQGVGTKLRALATIFSVFAGVPITQVGMWFIPRRPNNTNNRPPTTRILRNKLGWVPELIKNENVYKSVFNPRIHSVTRAKSVLG
jgi:hypothetical protein